MTPRERIFCLACAGVLLSFFPAGSPAPASAQPVAVTGANSADAVPTSLPGQTTTQIVISVIVNTEPKGDFFVELGGDGELFFKPEDLEALKIRYAEERAVLIHEEKHVPASAALDVQRSFNDKKLILSFIGKTTAAEKTEVDIFSLQVRPQNIYYPRETSVFLNYGLAYAYAGSGGFQSFTETNKLGARAGDVFFVSDSLYTKNARTEKFVRLQSSATYERRGELQWLVLGDQFAGSGDLASTVNLGGAGFSKMYRVDPYFITQPVLDLKGTTIFPAQAEVYLDGMLVGKHALAPGSFDLKNLYSFNGAHNIELVLKDPFGNERRITYPTYFNTLMLRKGLHEYRYHAGFLRENYGLENADYDSKPAFFAFHRYGLKNFLSLGAQAEGHDNVYNGSVSAQFTAARLGAFSLTLAESESSGRKGSAGSLQHSYQLGSFNTNALLRIFSRDYATVSAPDVTASEQTRHEAGIGAGFSLMPLGSLSLNYSENETYGELKTRVSSANYSRGIGNTTSFFMTVTETRQPSTAYSVFAGLNFTFDRKIHGAVQHNKTSSGDTETVQLQSDVPVGEGFGYRAGLSRTDTGTTSSTAFNPYVQYNARYGVYSLDARVQNASGAATETYTLNAAGSLVYAGGFTGLSRPVSDSFAVVVVNEVPDAAVLNNGQEIGTTSSSGELVVPALSSYGQNKITLNLKNVPLDYSVSGVNKPLSPPLWSGSCVAFDAVKTQAVVGTIVAVDGAKKEPLEFLEGTLAAGEQNITFPTGKGGEFYIENALPKDPQEGRDRQSCVAIAERRAMGGKSVKPGKYPAWIEYEGERCEFFIVFPWTDEPISDIGEVRCLKPGERAGIEKANPSPRSP